VAAPKHFDELVVVGGVISGGRNVRAHIGLSGDEDVSGHGPKNNRDVLFSRGVLRILTRMKTPMRWGLDAMGAKRTELSMNSRGGASTR